MAIFRDFFYTFVGYKGEEKNGFRVSCRLVDSPVFCSSFLSFVAGETGDFPSFEQWQRFLKSEHKPPKKPDRDNPFLYKNPEYLGRDDLEARTYRAYIFMRKMELYQAEAHRIAEKNEKKRRIKGRYSNDRKGYCLYILDRVNKANRAFIQDVQRLYIAEYRRLQHTYINGGSGSGKSELMKALIHHYLTKNKNTALVLLDPHGKIAQEVAQFKENAAGDRVVFIAPDFTADTSPVFNPFEMVGGMDALNLDIATQEIVAAFREILKDVGFTAQMETLLKPCIATLLLYPNGNIYHLQQFMSKRENSELLAFAENNLPNEAQRRFLQTDFLKTAYAPSRQSIRTKIQSLLNSQIFLDFLVGKNTFSLAEAIEQKKLIIFSLSRNSGAETSDTIGRLILSSLQSIAMQRARLSGNELRKAPPIHLFIDECQHYITPSIDTILTETRKYKLYLTLANQFLGQIENRRIRSAVKGNTALKITGRQTEPDTLAEISKITGANTEAIKALQVGEYHIKIGELPSLKVQGGVELLDNKNAMSAEQWEAFSADQVQRFYDGKAEKTPLVGATEEKIQHEKKKKTRGLN